MQLDLSFWRDRRVLVTGHTGFKGSWLATWLTRLGAEVTGLGLAPRLEPSLHGALGLADRLTSVIGDVRDRRLVARLVERVEPEVVFHLAAQPIVLDGLLDPVTTFETNIVGTLNVVEALRGSAATRAIVIVTSDKCYRDPHEACQESDPLGGDEPYAASKACAELVVHAYRRCFVQPVKGTGLATARAGNVIGGGDFSSHRLLPDLVRAFAAGRPVVLRQPGAVRPWQHVLDALAGYLQLAQALALEPERHSTAWNFGPPPGTEWTVQQVVGAAARRFGGGSWQLATGPAAHEAPLLRLSPERARRRLGWRTRLSTAEAVDWTIDGYKAFLDTGRADWLEDQLRAYAERLTAPRAVRRLTSVEPCPREAGRAVHAV